MRMSRMYASQSTRKESVPSIRPCAESLELRQALLPTGVRWRLFLYAWKGRNLMTIPSAEAMEKAKKLFIDIGTCPAFHQDNCSCFGKIAQVLEEFSDARIRKAVIDSFGPEYRQIRKEAHSSGYAEAREDAAKVARHQVCYYNNGACGPIIAKEIEALQPKAVLG